MNINFLSLTIELFIGFFALLILTKILGKNQINQLTPFDFISALVLGELVGNAIYDNEIGLHYVLFAILFWGSLIFMIEIITQKFSRTRSFLEGKPSIIIDKGKISYEELKKNKLDLGQLKMLLREKDVFSIREVEYGILEASGSISVLKKYPYRNPTTKDLSLPIQKDAMPVSIIMDGKILANSLKQIGMDETQLQDELLKRSIPNAKAVLYAEWVETDGFVFQTYS
ncbi:DUF421 domain-containing protein [Halalkalibacterium ligniniphilum]|uniref:DUF421 domain-containing protein n=1 Tax=Halalkalibacterium ligniniphilum TaxID=1134413 RepID=UPI00034D271E|nr:DUF421 domain-containing protein [Halalkalibacterium ligniniphilum]